MELVELVVATAGVGPGAAVLEVGCGTGQLTERLAPFGFALTAIGLGASMIEAARDAGSFDLVISAAAFHWVDPEVRFRKAARLLRPGGWLAVAGCQEVYDEPVGSALDDGWHARSPADGVWATRPADASAIADSGLFGAPVRWTFSRRGSYSAAELLGVENTRAASLSWPADVRDEFNAELRELLGGREVPLTVASEVTMAQVSDR